MMPQLGNNFVNNENSIVPSFTGSTNDNNNTINRTAIINPGETNHTYETNSNINNNFALNNHIGKDNRSNLLNNSTTTNLENNSSLLPNGLLQRISNISQPTLLSSSSDNTKNLAEQLGSTNNRIMNNITATTTNTTIHESEVWYGMPKMDNFVDVFSLCCSTAVIFGGLIPYIPQYLKIKHSMSSEGFSTYVCLTLLLANILRILFWFGHHFELPLLIQSFVMIAGMLGMMEICVRVRDKHSTYIISSIDFRPATSTTTRRRSLMGKIFGRFSNRPVFDETTGNESRPIYSSATSRSISQTVALLPPSSSQQHDELSTKTTYHNQHISAASNGHSKVDDSSDSYSSRLYDAATANDPIAVLSSNGTLVDGGHGFSSSMRSSMFSSSSNNNKQQLGQNKHQSALWSRCKWLNIRNFWDWNDLASYLKFLSLFTIILGTLTYLLINNSLYIETLGFVAVFTESMLGMPQLLRNYAKKSTRGMSVEMVVMWLSGDLFKTLYFILRHAPTQFVACGSIQVTVDIVILFQVFWFRRPNVTYRKLPKST